ncbi:hypothetical protein C8N43_1419 [Litoreibacter ponti]|uniref:Antibiotic biosynthesis monooxygenase n=1 Tax=Litoreibacter ponti TaxID=1510457 RepID=A0A2T6BL34_9RHOB|nr:hypothetical protein [Litoreibacter ponti]PTX56757.1 hypothetical protein C8N43_1419 [Litoreibacter ponti]
MYARITPYKMKPGSKAAAIKVMKGLKKKILALPGQQQFLNVMNDETGTGYVVSTTTLSEVSEETQAKIKALWAEFSEFLVEQPHPQSFEVIADWEHAAAHA